MDDLTKIDPDELGGLREMNALIQVSRAKITVAESELQLRAAEIFAAYGRPIQSEAICLACGSFFKRSGACDCES